MASRCVGNLQVERVMMASLRTITAAAVKDYATKARERWLLEWPGQVVLAVSQVFWTRAVDDALRLGGSDGLKAFAAQCSQALQARTRHSCVMP
jgi:dynein heavy chain, axonemal